MTQRLRFAAFAALIVALTASGTARVRADDEKMDVEAMKKSIEKLKKQHEEIQRLTKQLEALQRDHQKLLNKLQKIQEEEQWRREELKFLAPFPLSKPAPKLLPNIRGEVMKVAGDLVIVNIGIDSGLVLGTTLDVYRTEGGGRYLGTVKVTSALNLYPKEAIMTFTPAGKKPIDNLRPEELPCKGDVVRLTNALPGDQ